MICMHLIKHIQHVFEAPMKWNSLMRVRCFRKHIQLINGSMCSHWWSKSQHPSKTQQTHPSAIRWFRKLNRKQWLTEEGEQLSRFWQSINKISIEENPVNPSGSKENSNLRWGNICKCNLCRHTQSSLSGQEETTSSNCINRPLSLRHKQDRGVI